MSDPIPTRHPHWTFWLVALLLGLTPTPGLGQCTYTVEIIEAPTCPGDYPSPTFGQELNESGHVVGSYWPCTTGNDKAYVWTGGPGIMTLQPPQGTSEVAASDTNEIVGDQPIAQICGRLSNQGMKGFIWTNGQWTIVPPLKGDTASGLAAINDQSVAVGHTHDAFGTEVVLRAIRWQQGITTALSLPHGPDSGASDIGPEGEIVGWMGQSMGSDAHGFLWENGVVTDLGFLPRSTLTDPRGINRHRQIVGRAFVPSPDGAGTVAHAFLWDNGELIDLGLGPGMLQSVASDINDDSIVVGLWRATSTTDRPMIWRNGVMTDLATLIDPGAGVTVRRAVSINNAGQIVCTGIRHSNFNTVAILLTPTAAQPGDTDCDGSVGIDDLWNVIRRWGECDPHPAHCPADFNADDVVNVPDLITVLMNWG